MLRRRGIDLARPRPWIAVRIETKVRELDSRVLLAAVAAERGFGVAISGKSGLERLLKRTPPSLVFENSTSERKIDFFKKCGTLGHVVTTTDEEGAVYRTPEEHLRWKVSKDALRQCRAVFAWGQVNADVLGRLPVIDRGRIVAAGNPRGDLLRPEVREYCHRQAAELRRRLGPYVIINTNFSYYNHFLGLGEGGLTKRQQQAATEEQRRFAQGRLEFSRSMFEAFCSLTEILAEKLRGICGVVVRPHPSEDHNLWRERLAAYDNAFVEHEGNVVPWLVGATAVIHNSCTTGLEAVLLERPTFAYMPIRDPAFESPLPNDVSRKVESATEMVALLQGLHDGMEPPRSMEARAELAAHISGLDGPLASETIVEHLQELAPGPFAMKPFLGSPTRIRLGRGRARARDILRGGSIRVSDDGRRGYSQQKLPDLRRDEVETVLADLRAATGRFSRVSVKQLAPKCVAVAST